MARTFVYVGNTKAPFCVCFIFDFCAFVSFVSIVHVFLKRHFLTYSLYKLFIRPTALIPGSAIPPKNGADIHKRHKSLNALFIPFISADKQPSKTLERITQ